MRGISVTTSTEVSLTDFDDDLYLEKLNERIAEEGKFEQRS